MLASLVGEWVVEVEEDGPSVDVGDCATTHSLSFQSCSPQGRTSMVCSRVLGRSDCQNVPVDTASVSLEISKNEARSSERWLNDGSRIGVGSGINVSAKNVDRVPSKLLRNIVESRSPKTSKPSENSG
jgi:hypothetical protein